MREPLPCDINRPAFIVSQMGNLMQDMQVDDVEGPSLDAMVEDRIGLGSGRPKRRQKTHAA